MTANQHSNDLQKYLVKALKNSRHTDVKFRVASSNKDNKCCIINAHKLILSISPVFETMFYSDVSENFVVKQDVINIVDIHSNALQALIDLLYGSDVNITSPQMAVELSYAGDKYDIKRAREIAEEYFHATLSTENVIEFYELSIESVNEKWYQKCVELLMVHTDVVLLHESFLTCKPKTVNEIFSLNSLNIDSEMRLVEAYSKYLDERNIEDELEPALKAIRFLTIAPNELVRVGFLTKEEMVKIIRIVGHDETEDEMPRGFSVNRLTRFTKKALTKRELVLYTRKFIEPVKFNKSAFGNFISINDDEDPFTVIYKKYNHMNFYSYSLDDMQTLRKISQGVIYSKYCV